MHCDRERRHFLAASGAAAGLAWLPRLARAADAAAGGPPIARVEPVTETFFGQSVTDLYRWMENPEDKDWDPFIKGQAAYARRVLDAIPGREALLRRVQELSGGVEIVQSLQVADSFVFIEKRPAGAGNFQLYVRQGATGKERLLIDPDARKQGEVAYAMNYWLASPDGLHVLYGISASGSEQATIEIIETATGRVLPDRIDRVQYASPSWLEDGSGFFFNRLAAGAKPGGPDFYKDSVCWLHRLGTDASKDVKVLSRGQFADVAVRDIDFPTVVVQPGSAYVIGLLVAGVQRELTLFVNTLAAARRGEGGWKPVCNADDKVTGFTFRGSDIWLLTERGAPRGRVVYVKAGVPAFAGAREVVPQGKAVVRALDAARDAIYVQDLDGGIGRLRKFSGNGGGGAVSGVKLPFDGTLSFVFTDPRRDGAIAALESWVRPKEIVKVLPSGSTTSTDWAAKPAVDVSAFTSEQVYATAKDGTRIPVSLIYKKGLARDGSAPTMIDAYGSYAISSDPYFAPRSIAWLERGGVWAIAHVRGGGEYGREWHEAGRLLTKPNTWRDLIAAAEMLIAQRWTSPARLSIRGGAAGGITVGRALTERPDLFSAVISQVGISNPLRFEFSQNGPPNIPEFGSVQTESGFKGLYEMDATIHVRNGEAYPAVLLTTGLTDPRVDPWEAAKMAARLQAASSSGKPVLLRVEFQAGHGLGSTRAQRDLEVTDVYAFALWQAGVAGYQPAK
jgi:prolyl oligopeptidase